MVHQPCETAGSQASLSWVGRKIGSSWETSSQALLPTPSLAPPGRSHSDLPAVGGVLRAPGFQRMPPRCPGILLGLARGQQRQQKTQNTKQQRPWTEQYPKPHQRSPFSAGFVPVQSQDVWVQLPAPPHGQGQCNLWGCWFLQLCPPSGSPSLGGVNEREVRAGPTVKSQPRSGWKLFL